MTLEHWFSVEPFDWVAIGTAVFCGALVGLERQIRGKPVGIRTSALIVLGTYVFVAVTFSMQEAVLDASRVIGQVITGIGFLGAGVMLAKEGAVVGVTSAATIWVLAALGVVIATGHESTAVKLSILCVSVLWGVDILEDRVASMGRGVHAKVSSLRNPR